MLKVNLNPDRAGRSQDEIGAGQDGDIKTAISGLGKVGEDFSR